ncbi:MAG: hypothetical protein ACRDRJ_46970, partial [Streptosporangiaceae bacterium]
MSGGPDGSGAGSNGTAKSNGTSNGHNNGLGERATPKRGLGPSGAMPARGPASFMAGRSTEKSLDFKGSSRRLIGTLKPHRLLVAVSFLLAAVSVTLSVLGPKLLGDATNLIFSGVISSRLPVGV